MSKRIIEFDFSSVNELYLAYMPFISNGGLFIATRESFELGEEVGLDIRLMDEAERHELDGAVVWITPKGAQGGKPAGIGVQFEKEKGLQFRNQIETYLAGMLHSANATNTM